MLHYLAQDRRRALAGLGDLPTRAVGAALLADISGFTPLTEALTLALGQRAGGERVTDAINAVYDALIAAVDRFHGAVLGFAGDAITCWFDAADGPAAARAATCGLAMQQAMAAFAAVPLPAGGSARLELKVAIASGPARRFVVGDPAIQTLDVLAGATLARMAAAEHHARPGEVLLDAASVAALGAAAATAGWRGPDPDGARFAVLRALAPPADPDPWPELPPDAVGPERLRPWLQPAVYERERAGHGAFLTELRPAVALFLRFAGIDYDHDPGAEAALGQLIGAAQRTIAAYDGTLLQLTIGDKGSYLYAAFGAPTAHEDDARRAVLTALDLQRLAAAGGLVAPLQIGVSQGVLRCGAYGGATRGTYGVLGDAVNLAARLMALAAPGETLITEGVARATAASVVLEPRPPVRLKGKAEPQPVFVVRDVRQGRATRLLEPDYALPMVGRAAALARLAQALERARAGAGHVVALSAEAGMGKSRLIAEGIRLARQRGMAGYGGACQATGTRTPYLVWQPIWRAFFDLDLAPPAQRLPALERRVAAWAPERREALPLLGPLVGLAIAESAFTTTLEPRDRQGALHALLRDCLAAGARAAAAAGGGILLVLEDLHWIDGASEELLLELAGAIDALPVLIVGAYRPPDQSLPHAAILETLPGLVSIPLPGLDAAAAEELVQAKLGQLFPGRTGRLAPALVARLVARAQGNPFYLEELLNYLHDRGVDPRDIAGLEALALPDSLHRLILSRLDALSARQQVTLKTASVIGRRFLVAWLSGAFPTISVSEQLRGDLENLAHSDLTTLDTPEPELAYLFKQVVTREVAYESLGAATRAALHGQLADYLERALAGPELALAVDLLAYHYEQSDNLPQKRVYLRRAGEAAAARYANDAAAAYLGRALDLAPADDPAERRALLLAREAVSDVQGDRAAQAADLDALEALAAAEGDAALRAEVALRRARLAAQTGDFQGAAAAAAAAAELARAAGHAQQEAAARRRWGWALLNQRAYPEARAQLEQSLALARANGDRRQECLTLNDLGSLAADEGRFADAQAAYVASLAIARDLGDRRQESSTLGNLGTVVAGMGDLAAARAHLEQGLALAREIGARQLESATLGNLSFLLSLLGDYPSARAFGDESVAVSRAIGNRSQEGYTLGTLGLIALNQGDLASAGAYYRRSLALAETIGDAQLLGWSRRGLGGVALGAGDLAAAEQSYAEALATLQGLGSPALAAEALAGIARVALARGDLAAALDAGERILAHLRAGTLDGAEEPMAVYLACYEALRAAGDPRAAALLARAHAELQEQAARISDPAARRTFLGAVPAHRALAAALAATPREQA